MLPPALMPRMPTTMIDINTATAADIDTAPDMHGHGYEIVRYREERGRFESLRQLDEVPGLSGKVTDAARSVLTVGKDR